MAIKLRVISDHQRDLGEHRSRVFGVNGGTIGRAPDNDWVLPDAGRLVSGHHCEIQYRGGGYWLHDISTNGVFVNDAEEPVSTTGARELRDGDRLRIGAYELIVSIDTRTDFLPAASEEHSAAAHLDTHLGADLDMDDLIVRRDPEQSGSISVRNAFGLRLPTPKAPAPVEREAPVPPAAGVVQEWAMKTRAITREELADAIARRQSRIEARQQAQPFHQQATSWGDLRSAVQAFCRGAGIEPTALTSEAQSMLPLIAGQLLREAVVGLNDLSQSRMAPAGTAPRAAGSNPLRTSSSVEQAIVRLFESHGRIVGGPTEALRDVLQDAKDHEIAVQSAVRAGLEAVLEQLAPGNVADQFEQGRARSLAPGQDPRPKYWEHYSELFRVITQSLGSDSLPHPFTEAFARAYAQSREELRARRRERESGGDT